ncbi:hypothetical protein [Microscilla marina]|uniref:Uncharacterized protein n=1 Tax=Microscilla marina ATCC 23134 TaxID=313606 RepID=A1ZUJ0_MICM2|nr:hypothetical protein [Microscilla marina]EAY26009.1 hypothetical protein M23134_07158 [Microscilla marina ATCC 23134]
MAAQNIIDLIVSGKIAQVNQPSLVKTLGDIRHAMKQYLEGNLKVPLLRMLDKQTQNSGGTNTAPDHRQTNAFMHKLKRGLATIQGAYKGKQPFVAQLTTEVLGLINRYEHRDLTPKKEVEKEERIVDPVTTQYASETNYAMYQVIGELIDNPKYRKIFELPTKLQDKRLKVIIEEIRKKHNYQSVLDVNGKVNFDYDARQEVLRRFSEWSLRKKGKSLEKQLFKSREDAFNAAKAEAKTILTKTDKVVWQANDQLMALYHQGVVGLIQRRMLSLEKLLGKTNWKQLFKEAGLYALLDKINFQEGVIYGARKEHYQPIYDYVNGYRIDSPQGGTAGGQGNNSAPPKAFKTKLKDMVTDYYLRYRYTKQRLKKSTQALDVIRYKNSKISIRYGERHDESAERGLVKYDKQLLSDAKKAFRAIARTYFLNEDFASSERTGFAKSLLEGLAESTFWTDYSTNTDFAQAMAQNMQYEGLALTKKQLSRAKQSLTEQIGTGIGTSIPVMLEIMATTLITEGVGTLPAIARAGNALVKTLRLGERTTRVLRAALVNSIAFKLAGQSEYSGLGEGIIQGLVGGRLPLLKLLNKPAHKIVINSFINNVAIRYGAHVATETTQEYAGDLMDNLMKDGTFASALRKTFGANLDQAGEKLVVTAAICAFFGSAGSVKGFVADTTLQLQAKKMQATTTEAKLAYTKALALLATVDHLQPETKQKGKATPYQIQAAPRVPQKIEESPELEILYKELTKREAHKKRLEEGLGELQGKVGIQVEYGNPKISGKTVQAHYTTQTRTYAGVFSLTTIDTVQLRVGPDATIAHTQEHLATLNYMRRYQGLSGRMRAWGDQFKKAIGWHGIPQPGTALWESKQKIEKLSAILMQRAQAIEAGKFDPAQAPEIETELGVILLQLEYFEEVAHSVSADTKGVGYVAMEENVRLEVLKSLDPNNPIERAIFERQQKHISDYKGVDKYIEEGNLPLKVDKKNLDIDEEIQEEIDDLDIANLNEFFFIDGEKQINLHRVFDLEDGFIDLKYAAVPDAFKFLSVPPELELVPGKGFPASTFFTVLQGKKAGFDFDALKGIKISNMVNTETALELAYLMKKFPNLDPNELFQFTHSFGYVRTLVEQVGKELDAKVDIQGLNDKEGLKAEVVRKMGEYGLTKGDFIPFRYNIIFTVKDKAIDSEQNHNLDSDQDINKENKLLELINQRIKTNPTEDYAFDEFKQDVQKNGLLDIANRSSVQLKKLEELFNKLVERAKVLLNYFVGLENVNITNAEKKIINQPHEHAYVFTKKGGSAQAYHFTSNQRTTVGFTEPEGVSFEGATMTHNHPPSAEFQIFPDYRGTTFSTGDYTSAAKVKLKELRMVTIDGAKGQQLFVLKKASGENFDMSDYDFIKESLTYTYRMNKKLRQLANQRLEILRANYPSKITSDSYRDSQMIALVQYEIWGLIKEELEEDGGIIYESYSQGKLVNFEEELKNLF